MSEWLVGRQGSLPRSHTLQTLLSHLNLSNDIAAAEDEEEGNDIEVADDVYKKFNSVDVADDGQVKIKYIFLGGHNQHWCSHGMQQEACVPSDSQHVPLDSQLSEDFAMCSGCYSFCLQEFSHGKLCCLVLLAFCLCFFIVYA